jgi:hypothetical protein
MNFVVMCAGVGARQIDCIQRKHQEKSPPGHNISFIVKTYRMSNTTLATMKKEMNTLT